jgi:hypothetical protein
LQDVSADEAQVVFAVTTPCLHEPQGDPDEVIHVSFRSRLDPSMVEMARQKSPLTTLQVESSAQLSPLVSLHQPTVVGVSTRQSTVSVPPLEPQAKTCVAVAVLVTVCVAVCVNVSVTVIV